tara:strand:+ start:408 stop:1733 length:1326 start_codon:yes stop_codon:yes gene_type:complete
MDIGAIFSGIGTIAETAVVQGRKNKHQKEQLELQDSLARSRQKENRNYSRQQEALKLKNEMKMRFRELQRRGLSDEIALYASQNDYTYEGMLEDLNYIKELNDKDGMNRNYSDIFSVDFEQGKAPKLGDMKTYEPSRARELSKVKVNVDSVFGQIDKAQSASELADLNLGYVVKRNQDRLRDAPSNEKMIEIETETLTRLTSQLKDTNRQSNPALHKQLETKIAETKLSLRNRVESQSEISALLATYTGKSLFTEDQVKDLNKERRTKKNDLIKEILTIRGEAVPEGLAINPLLLLNNFKFAGDGTAIPKDGASAESLEQMERLYQYANDVASKHINSYMELSGYSEKQIEEYGGYMSGINVISDPKRIYTGQKIQPDKDGIITPQFYGFLKKNLGKTVSVMTDQGQTIFDLANPNNKMMKYIQDFEQFTTPTSTFGAGVR